MENLRLTCPQCNQKRKKRFTFKEIVGFAENCGELPQSAALIQSNPIQSESKSESKCASAKDDAFERFWEVYPKKRSKQAAEKAFKKVKVPIDVLIAAVERQKKSKDWLKDGGQFIPYPATWLNQGRWEDEVDGVTMESSSDVDDFGGVF